MLVERGDAVVVEASRRGAEDRHVGWLLAERLPVANQLAADVPQCVCRATTLELVDRDDVGEVEHVDLLQLGGGAELGGHHVERGVDEGHDGGVALADARGLDDHQVEAGALEDVDHVGQVLGHLVGPAGGHRAEVDAIAVERVHPDPVAQQCAAALASGGVDREHGYPQLVLLVDPEAPHQLVGERRLARAAGAGDAEHRHCPAAGRGAQRGQDVVRQPALLGRGDRPGDGEPVATEHLLGGDDAAVVVVEEVAVARGDHGVDHPDQAHPLAVLGGEDRHAALAQPGDLLAHDDPAATTDDLHVAGALGAQRLDEVLEVLDVTALVGRDGDAVHVLLDRRVDDLLHRAVVPEVDHLAPLALEDPPHDVDRGVVAVEEARGGDEAHRVGRYVELGRLRHQEISGAVAK